MSNDQELARERIGSQLLCLHLKQHLLCARATLINIAEAMRLIHDRYIILWLGVGELTLSRCVAFVQTPSGLRGISPSLLQYPELVPTGASRPSVNRPKCLRMAKKGGGSGKRKKKRPQPNQTRSPSEGGATSVADTESSPDVSKAAADLEDAGAPMSFKDTRGPLGATPFDALGNAASGVILPDGVAGTDEAREAKIEETLRRLGVKGAEKTKQAVPPKEEPKNLNEQLSSVFDNVSPEAQVAAERVFIAGFALCLTFLVGCGIIIGIEAYQMSTTGQLPKELDDLLVQKLQPLFTPSLIALFGFSISLGILKIGQLGQSSVVYKEDD